MFRCSGCKKWLVPSKITVMKDYQDNIVQIDDFLGFKVHEDILDYETFEAIEIALITNMF